MPSEKSDPVNSFPALARVKLRPSGHDETVRSLMGCPKRGATAYCPFGREPESGQPVSQYWVARGRVATRVCPRSLIR